MCVPYPLAQPLLSTSVAWRHHDVISAKAQGGNMGTFSILFRMVLRSTLPIFSFLLIFSKLDQKMSQFYWTIPLRPLVVPWPFVAGLLFCCRNGCPASQSGPAVLSAIRAYILIIPLLYVLLCEGLFESVDTHNVKVILFVNSLLQWAVASVINLLL